LAVIDAKKMLVGMKGKVNGMVSSMLQQAAEGHPVSAKDQAILDRMRSNMLAALDETFTWDALVPVHVRTYKVSFTQVEMDGMSAFYKTPAGQALSKTIPVVMKNIMNEMPGLMEPMLERLQVIQRDAIQELEVIPNRSRRNQLEQPAVETEETSQFFCWRADHGEYRHGGETLSTPGSLATLNSRRVQRPLNSRVCATSTASV
jgi:uncharacterized protein